MRNAMARADSARWAELDVQTSAEGQRKRGVGSASRRQRVVKARAHMRDASQAMHERPESDALHDALVKAMPGQTFAPSLAQSWTASDDGLVYDETKGAWRKPDAATSTAPPG